MPIKSESSTPPPRIAKIGPYTVFVTPPATPNATPKPNSPRKLEPVEDPIQKPVQPPTPPPVMAPPAQFYKEKPSYFAFIWDAVAKVQNAHASLDEQVAHWFGLNQSKYQWALDDYYETNGMLKFEWKQVGGDRFNKVFGMATDLSNSLCSSHTMLYKLGKHYEIETYRFQRQDLMSLQVL